MQITVVNYKNKNREPKLNLNQTLTQLQVPIFEIVREIHKFSHHKTRLPHSAVEFVLLKMAQVSFQSVPKSHTIPEASELCPIPLSSWQEIGILISLQPRRSSEPQILDPLEEGLGAARSP
jgi:hypothetical protein